MARIANSVLVAELKGGERAGCSHLLDIYQGRLIGEAVNVFGVCREDAEELVSDVLITVVRRVNEFEFRRGEGDFHLWVMTIFRNRVRDHMRRRALTEGFIEHFTEGEHDEEEYTKADREVIAEAVRRYQDSLCAESASGGRDGVGVAESLSVVCDTLDRMEPWERVLLRCRALDVPYQDIAHYTGKTVRQLKVYFPRVKRRFIRMMAGRLPHVHRLETPAAVDEA